VFTWCAAREDHRAAEPDHDLGWLIRHHVLVAPALAVLAGVVAYVHPLWTMVLWAVEAVLVLTTLVSGVRGRRRGDGFAAEAPRPRPT
jgi:Flp pilus assembly protein TadB